MRNNKGFTIVELIMSFAFVSILSASLFKPFTFIFCLQFFYCFCSPYTFCVWGNFFEGVIVCGKQILSVKMGSFCEKN